MENLFSVSKTMRRSEQTSRRDMLKFLGVGTAILATGSIFGLEDHALSTAEVAQIYRFNSAEEEMMKKYYVFHLKGTNNFPVVDIKSWRLRDCLKDEEYLADLDAVLKSRNYAPGAKDRFIDAWERATAARKQELIRSNPKPLEFPGVEQGYPTEGYALVNTSYLKLNPDNKSYMYKKDQNGKYIRDKNGKLVPVVGTFSFTPLKMEGKLVSLFDRWVKTTDGKWVESEEYKRYLGLTNNIGSKCAYNHLYAKHPPKDALVFSAYDGIFVYEFAPNGTLITPKEWFDKREESIKAVEERQKQPFKAFFAVEDPLTRHLGIFKQIFDQNGKLINTIYLEDSAHSNDPDFLKALSTVQNRYIGPQSKVDGPGINELQSKGLAKNGIGYPVGQGPGF